MDFPDPDVGRSIKEAADRERAARAERARLEAERRGDLERAQVKKIVDDMDAWDGLPPYRDDVAEILAGLEGEEES